MIDGTAQNSRQMKAMNRLRALRLIRRAPIARSELAVEMGLTRAAMSLIATGLLRDGIVEETGLRESKAGRRPVLLKLRSDYCQSAGLVITRMGAEVGVIDFAGRLLNRLPVNTGGASRAMAVHRIKRALQRVLASCGPASGRLLGLGISTPGPVDVAAGTILNPPNFALWRDFPICDVLRDAGGGRVFLENNSQSLTIAERSYGRGREHGSFLLLVVESGVGGGIVHNGERYSGWRGFGNEIGHTSINHRGLVCNCGLRGCVELYASVPAAVRAARRKRPGLKDWCTLVDLAHSGDLVCRRALEEQASALAAATVNMLNTLELDAVILTGEILYRGELLRAAIEQRVNASAINRRLRHIPVYLSPLGEHCEILAAAALPIERFFRGDIEAL